ncbi:unnamed protein product [Mortierella alpina]
MAYPFFFLSFFPPCMPPGLSIPGSVPSSFMCAWIENKIKCNVEKCYPCKNCEKNAVQCTMVGPSMRPPRAISGSSSAAAAAAVAMAMATVANARLSGTNHGLGFEGPLEDGRGNNGVARPSHGEDPRARLAAARLEEYQRMGFFTSGPVLRRASASARTSDDGSGSTDHSRPRRKLQSYSSSPSSLRNLFVLGAGGQSTLRSPASGPQSRKFDVTTSLMRHSASAASLAGRDASSDFKTCTSYDTRSIFSFSSSQSAPSSSFSSLPPTPTHPAFAEDSSDHKHVSPTFSHDAPALPFHSSLGHPSHHRANGHFLKHHLHRTPYMQQLQYSRGHSVHLSGGLPDRRSSLPWDVHISSAPTSTSDVRADVDHRSESHQPGASAVDGPILSRSGSTVRHKSLQQQYIPPQAFLVRSNSTPAIFSSIPSRSGLYSGQQGTHQQNGSNLFSPAPQRVAALDSFPKTLYTSMDPSQYSAPFLHPHDTPSEMPGHPLDMVHDASDRSLTTQQPYGDVDPSQQESDRIFVKEEDTYADGQNHRLQAFSAQVRQQGDHVNMEEHRQQQPTSLRHITASQRSSGLSSSQPMYRPSYTTTSFQQPGAIESERCGQVQQLKLEQMDDNEAFDSSLAMVLDDHLSLMDHLDMMPDIHVYGETPQPSSSIQPSFHGSESTRNLGPGYCSETAPASNSMTYFTDLAHGPSDMAAVKHEEFPDEDPMLYFDGLSSSSSTHPGHDPDAVTSLSGAITSTSSVPAVASSEAQQKGFGPSSTSFGFMQGGEGQPIKLEPSFPQMQRQPQHYIESSYHPLEQQHPLEMGSTDMAQRSMIPNGISTTAASGFGPKAQQLQHQHQHQQQQQYC